LIDETDEEILTHPHNLMRGVVAQVVSLAFRRRLSRFCGFVVKLIPLHSTVDV